jgi:adenylate cyclase
MFTDMVGYSALAQRNEALALELLAEQQRLLRTQFPLFNGREVKTTGDGFLVEFPSALEATQCAVEIQKTVIARNSTQPSERHIHVRIGIHVGDVVHREADMYGDGVNIAARIEPLARGGGICMSDAVYAQVRNKLNVGVTKLAAPELKHIEVPMDVYRVVLPWETQRSSKREEAHSGGRTKSQSLLTSAATRWVGVAAIVVVAIGIGWWLVHRERQAATLPNAKTSAGLLPAAEQKSIAVLPFVSMSADKADEYLSDGMSEELLNVLAKVPGLRVPGRSSSFAFKGKSEENIFRKVGEQLRVSTVLEGSVRKAGDKLRITAQLISVADGFHLWSETYDGEMKDILAFQSDVAQRVVQALQVELGVEATRALVKNPTENPEAQRLYLLGRHYYFKGTEENNKKAIKYFNQALQQDPKYARAYSGLADTVGDWKLAPKEFLPKLRAYAETALKLDPLLAEARVSMAVILLFADWDFPGAEKEFQQALKLNPNLALAHNGYAWHLTMRGHFPEALLRQKKAVELDPLSAWMNADLSLIYLFARDFNKAIEFAKQAAQLDPSYPWSYGALAWSLLMQGKTAESIPEFEKLGSLADYPWTRAWLNCAYAAGGNSAKAEAGLKELDDLATRQFVPPNALAQVCVFLGQKDRALERLERAIVEHDPNCLYLKVDPALDSLRTEPRFQALVKKIGFEK